MAFEENAQFETKMASSNVSAISYTSSDGAVITYSSGGIPQFSVVKEDTSSAGINDVIVATQGDKALGVSQDAPAVAAGQAVRVCVRGTCKVLAGAAVAIGDTVYVLDSSGRVGTIPTAANNFAVGRARTAATAAGDLISIEVNPSDGKVVMP